MPGLRAAALQKVTRLSRENLLKKCVVSEMYEIELTSGGSGAACQYKDHRDRLEPRY